MRAVLAALSLSCSLALGVSDLSAQLPEVCWQCYSVFDPETGGGGSYCAQSQPAGGQTVCIVSCSGNECSCSTGGNYCSYTLELQITPDGKFEWLRESGAAVVAVARLRLDCATAEVLPTQSSKHAELPGGEAPALAGDPAPEIARGTPR
jgi:hypothetical protein